MENILLLGVTICLFVVSALLDPQHLYIRLGNQWACFALSLQDYTVNLLNNIPPEGIKNIQQQSADNTLIDTCLDWLMNNVLNCWLSSGCIWQL